MVAKKNLPLTDPNAALLTGDRNSSNRLFVPNALKTIYEECVDENWQNRRHKSNPLKEVVAFQPSSETTGSGCCGIVPLTNLRRLYPAGIYNHEMGNWKGEDWKTFRNDIKDLFHSIRLIGADGRKLPSRKSGKVIMVTLTVYVMKTYPHLVELLDFLGFEVVSMFTNSTTTNAVVVFHLYTPENCKKHTRKNDFDSSPVFNSDAYKRMYRRGRRQPKKEEPAE